MGDDGTIWGGEFLHLAEKHWKRVGSLRAFRLPGGDAAAREPRRSALALLAEIGLGDPSGRLGFTARETEILTSMIGRGLQSPRTSSLGRLFDAVAALTGVCLTARFEGEAAMALESLAVSGGEAPPYEWRWQGDSPRRFDWEPMVLGILSDRDRGVAPARIAARFHATLIELITGAARLFGEAKVCLSGGCFQNAILVDKAVSRLRAEGFTPLWHRRLPPNDGGLSFGQLAAVAWARTGGFPCA
jgi:hydrogenase maturation protein HypF